MKLYKKMKRAVAYDGYYDPHFKPLEPIYYDWYDEDDFPNNMEEIVKNDNPFGGWYEYRVQSTFVEITP